MSNSYTNVESLLHLATRYRHAYVKSCSRSLKDDNFSPSEIEILLFLSNNPHINTPKELSVFLHQSKGLIARSVESLLKRRLIAVDEDTIDRRIHHLVLKEECKEIILLIREDQEQFKKEIVKNISSEEWGQMIDVWNRIDENIQNIMKGNEQDDKE